jgi:hypothetical protein
MAGFSKFLNPECTMIINRNIVKYNPTIDRVVLPSSQNVNGETMDGLLTSKRKSKIIRRKTMNPDELIYIKMIENKPEEPKIMLTWDAMIKFMELPESPEIGHKMAKFIREFEKYVPYGRPKNPEKFIEMVRYSVDNNLSLGQFVEIIAKNS